MNRLEAFAMVSAPGQPLEMIEVDVYGRSCRDYKYAPQSLRDLYQQNLSNKPSSSLNRSVIAFSTSGRLPAPSGLDL